MSDASVLVQRLAEDCLVLLGADLDAEVAGGSGAWIAPGFVLTCAHVVPGGPGTPVQVRWRDRTLPATVVARFPDLPPGSVPTGRLWPFPDLAIVAVTDPGDHPCVLVADESPVVDGRELMLFGHSRQLDDQGQLRPLAIRATLSGWNTHDEGRVLQVKDNEVLPGMSGGLVLDLHTARVCALTTTTIGTGADRGGYLLPLAGLAYLPDAGLRARLRDAAADFHTRHPDWTRLCHRSTPAERVGAPIGEWDPIDLEVHRAITLPGQDNATTGLPPYVRRAHDRRLREVVRAAARGVSGVAVLVGGSSTGKTRACWEAIQDLPDRWWVWHPIDPTRPDAALRELAAVGPHTVVWLNEAQHYLLTSDPAVGERIAAGLRTLLRDPARGPVLVLATMWQHPWETLTTPPRQAGPDPHPQARELLTGKDITVPNAFTEEDLRKLRKRAAAGRDGRLRHAVEHARDGRITQHLAGVPALLARYRNAPPAARAVIDVAIDARRLGHPLPIPYALLEQAAPGYLDDHDWEQAEDDWLDQALAYTAVPCLGVPGPLVRIRLRPGQDASDDGRPRYRLADPLEQIGSTERASAFPPTSFWDAVTTGCRDPQTLCTLAKAALDRGRWHRAHRLFRAAADLGAPDALRMLALRRAVVGDHATAEALAVQAADHGDAAALRELSQRRWKAGDIAAAERLARQAADHGDTLGLLELADAREIAGDPAGAARLAREAADQGDVTALLRLALLREQRGDHGAAEALAEEAVDRGDVKPLLWLASWRRDNGRRTSAERILRRAAERGNSAASQQLAELRDETDGRADPDRSLREAADNGDIDALLLLAGRRASAGDLAGAEQLYRQAADRGDENALMFMASERYQAGDSAGAERALLEAVERDPRWRRVRELDAAGDHAGAETLAMQAADDGDHFALRKLAARRYRAGAVTDAVRLLQADADRGSGASLRELAAWRQATRDRTGAERMLLAAVNCGDEDALWQLLDLREQAGDAAGAERLRRFALTDDGGISEPWD